MALIDDLKKMNFEWLGKAKSKMDGQILLRDMLPSSRIEIQPRISEREPLLKNKTKKDLPEMPSFLKNK